MVRTLLLLLLLCAPVTAWSADKGTPHRAHVAVGTLLGMPVGGVAGGVAWGLIREQGTCTGNDIQCGMGPVIRVFLLGTPIGIGWGAFAGGTIAAVASKSPRLVRTLLWGGGFALAGTVLLAFPLNIVTVSAGWVCSILATPVAMIVTTPARGDARFALAPMAVRGGMGARLSFAW